MERVVVGARLGLDLNGSDQQVTDSGGDAVGNVPDGGSPSRRQIGHDIHHELATIMLLATLLTDEPDAGPRSRHRARLILGEARWLEQLQRAYESADTGDPCLAGHVEPVRLDDVGADVVEAIRSSTLAHVTLTTERVYGWVNRLDLWRALRNVLDNAVRAAGPDGTVRVRMFNEDGWVTIQVDDDGPGFGASPGGGSALGLNIVQQFVASAGGQLEITRGLLGGCCVKLQIPQGPPVPVPAA
ncbi:MAG TPA: HAMP domain-containing sensor histidine kinase [Micromonosporaceae bacterium]|nr:HAMP domain-containing sensor histidine kinase [Micromonosporaceae bacterium]